MNLRNNFVQNLGEFRYNEDETNVTEKAYSWISLIVEPSEGNEINCEFEELLKHLNNYDKEENKEPIRKFKLPNKRVTTHKSLILYDDYYNNNSKFWNQYLRITFSGCNIEYVDSRNTFWVYKGDRTFRFIQIIGISLQFLFLAKYILTNNNFNSNINFILNLVGTKDTFLEGFSRKVGKDNQKWDGNRLNHFKSEEFCQNKNLQIGTEFILSNLDEKKSKEITIDFAKQLSLAYNHHFIPNYYCFDWGTTDFPWYQFLKENIYY